MPTLTKVLTYEGSEEFFRKTIVSSLVMNGTWGCSNGTIKSTVVQVSQVPCTSCGYPTDSLTLLCDKCTSHAAFLAETAKSEDTIL